MTRRAAPVVHASRGAAVARFRSRVTRAARTAVAVRLLWSPPSARRAAVERVSCGRRRPGRGYSLIVAFTLLTTGLVAGAVAPPALADTTLTAGSACSPNTTSLDVGVAVRCIDHIALTSRQSYINPACITTVFSVLPGTTNSDGEDVYGRAACGSNGRGAEAIAQARFLNREGGAQAGYQGGLVSNFQYEVNIPNAVDVSGKTYRRADVLFYPHPFDAPATTPSAIQMYEFKGTWNGTATQARAQVGAYVRGWNTTERGLYGSANADPGTYASQVGYTDQFAIELAKCDPEDTQRRYEHYTVSVDPTQDGLLIVDRSFDPCQDSNQTTPAGEQSAAAEGLSPAEEDRQSAQTGNVAGSWGDPHLVTVDGLGYDLQSAGEFDLASSPRYRLRVQARFTPRNGSWSGLAAVAASVGVHRVELSMHATLVDGQPVALDGGGVLALGTDGLLTRSDDGSRYFVHWAATSAVDQPVLTFAPSSIAAGLGLYYPSGPSDLTGLLGNADGSPDNDLALRDGTPLGVNPSAATLHGSYADSWRITDATSLFTYDSGQDTESFTDRSFPSSISTIDDVDPSARDLAIAACEQQGVVSGPQFDDCVLDVARTQNTQYAGLAGQFRTPLLGAGDARVGADGALKVDFEGDSVAPNFNSGQLVSDTKLSNFAGPFSGTSTYRFYIPELPPHVQASVSFDLIALGDWSDSTVETLNLAIDQRSVWSQEFGDGSPQLVASGTGTTDSGTVYTTYHVTVPFGHDTSRLSAVFSATGVDGLANKAFGIDNIQTQVTVIPPKVFDLGPLTLGAPLTVSDQVVNGTSTPGAGDLESRLSRDEYRFHLAATQTLLIDFSGSGRTPPVRLVGPDGVTVSTSTGTTQETNLPPGDYQLYVGDDSNGSDPGTYQFALEPSSLQSFDVGAVGSGSPVSISDGVPAAGAGRLETLAAEDDYTFSLNQAGAAELAWSCPAMHNNVYWRLFGAGSSSALMTSASCNDAVTPSLDPGDYVLKVAAWNDPGPYSLTITTVPPTQVFDLGLVSSSPVSVADGMPASGAGDLESRLSRDEYRFHLAATQTLLIDFSGSGRTPPVRLVGPDGVTVSTSTGTTQETNLPPGDYQLYVGDDSNGSDPGTYQFALEPSSLQSFDVGAVGSGSPVSISDGVPAAGAGRLETLAAEDDYTFSLNQAGAAELAWSCPAMHNNVYWRLFGAGSSSALMTSASCNDAVTPSLDPGDYVLKVAAWNDPGPYSLTITTVPPTQVFDLGLVSSSPVSVADGMPASGAGDLESRLSRDEYRFHLAATQTLLIDFSGSGRTPPVRLVGPDGVTVSTSTGTTQETNLPPGDYQLYVGDDSNGSDPGTYQFALEPSSLQSFDVGAVGSGSPVSISDGVPAAGAGRLETLAAEDDYTFSLNQAGAAELAWSCPAMHNNVYWRLFGAGSSSALMTSASCNDAVTPSLDPGDYVLKVAAWNDPGPYSLTITWVDTSR